MLNTEELLTTSAELRANLELTGLTTAEVAADLGWSAARLHAVLHMTGPSDPVDAWQLRDYLDRAVQDLGRTPVPFTVLTPGNRARARLWFRLRTAPRHEFQTA